MGLRFRKNIRIAPGIRMNISPGGVSASVGPRGASLSVGRNGIHGNASLPGTGLSYRKKLAGSSRQRAHKAELTECPERITLTLDEKGALSAVGPDGSSLSGAGLRQLWEEKGDDINAWLHDRITAVNGEVSLLADIHLDMPNPRELPKFEPALFDTPKPTRAYSPDIPLAPDEHKPVRRWWHRLTPGGVARHEAAVKEAVAEYDRAIDQWKEAKTKLAKQQANARSAYNKALSEWEKEKVAHEYDQALIAGRFDTAIREDIEFQEVYLAQQFEAIDWPRETLISFELNSGGCQVAIDIDLPEIEDLPQKVATLSINGKRLLVKDKPQKTLRLEYARHIHGIILRTAGVALASLPTCDSVVISGYSQRLDNKTGKVNDDYLISVIVKRSLFETIDCAHLERVDPVEALTLFEHVRKMTSTGIFKPIAPFV